MLRYPHARLALVNRLLNQDDCTQAFAATAKEFGLRCDEDITDVHEHVSRGNCGSMAAAKRVLQQTLPEDCEQLWQQLCTRVEDYKRELPQEHCHGDEKDTIGCTGMAPVVMDLMLQLIMPYLRHDGQ